jgi:hypothetical protein
MIRPSAPLSNSTRALICLPECFPTRVPLSMIDGDNIFRVTFEGTCSDSTVSRNL